MERLDGQDELISRIAAIDPVLGAGPLSEGALERVARSAMAPAHTSWTWARFKFATLGAGVVSGAVVVAGILGLQAAVPSLPVLALGAAPSGHHLGGVGSAAPSASGNNGMMLPALQYEFTVSPALTISGGPGTAYQLASSTDARTAAAQLASAFNVQGAVTSPYDGDYQVGPDSGPYVSTWTSNEVVNWTYESASGSSISSSAPPAPSSLGGGSLPTDSQASADALALLASAGITQDLGTPTVDDSDPTQVAVTIPMVVAGQTTDQSYSVDYGSGGSVQSANGILAIAVAGATYPTISPFDAVSILQERHGFIIDGGVQAPGTPVLPPTTTTTIPGGTSSGSSPGSGPTTGAGTGITTPTPTTVPPVVNVEINQANQQLGTFSMTDGTSWLLPVWSLSGPESGPTVTSPSTYSASVLAVDPQYVQIQAEPLVY